MSLAIRHGVYTDIAFMIFDAVFERVTSIDSPVSPCRASGVRDDRGVRAGVHCARLVVRMLLSLQRMAGTPPLRPQAVLRRRRVFIIS